MEHIKKYWSFYFLGLVVLSVGIILVNRNLKKSSIAPKPPQGLKLATGGNVNPISQRVNCKPGDQPKWVPANNVWGWLGWSGHWSCQTIPSN